MRSISKVAFRVLALATIMLVGCSEQVSRPRPACELMVTRICSAAAETQLTGGVTMISAASPAKEPQVVPYIVPVLQPDGALAAEVDCYANTDFHTYSIVHTEIAIAPQTREALDFLRDQHLCTDEDVGSLARL